MSLADLQRHLTPGMKNPQPPKDLLIGETAFCTYPNIDPTVAEHYMWVCLLGRDQDSGGNTSFRIHDKDEQLIWVDASYFWTKAQVQALAGVVKSETPRYEYNLHLPDGVAVKDAGAVVQAVINLLRDANIRGRAGLTNLPAVKCDIEGLTLGHIYKVCEALGDDVCNVINRAKNLQQ